MATFEVPVPQTINSADSAGTPESGSAPADLFFGPLAMLTAVIFGSAVAISFGLLSVSVIFWLLRADSEQVNFELGRIPLYSVLFLSLCAVSGPALYGTLKRLHWHWYAQVAMWGYVVWMVWWFTRTTGN